MKTDVRRFAVTALIAALYAGLTWGFSFMSFGSVQFRIAEVLNLMAFIDPFYGIGVVLGCFIANFTSPLGPIDVVVGTLATAIAVIGISKCRSLFMASFIPVIANTLVSLELTYIFGTPLWYNLITVAIGEFVVVVCAGYPLFRYLIYKNILRPKAKPETSRIE